MELTIFQYVAAAAIMFASSVLQGWVGFASGIFGIPLLLMAGFTLPQAVTTILLTSTMQTVVGSYQLRHEIEFRRVLRPMLIRLSALPLGVAALWAFASLDRQTIKSLIGVLILAILVVQWLWRARPVSAPKPAWEWVAFSLSGFLLGFCGMGGPPMVLWVMAHDWSTTRSRAFLFFMLLTGMIPQGLLLYYLFGNEVLQAALLGLLGIPLVVAGSFLGLRLGAGLPKAHWRRLSYGVLALIAITTIASPLWQRSTSSEHDPIERRAPQDRQAPLRTQRSTPSETRSEGQLSELVGETAPS